MAQQIANLPDQLGFSAVMPEGISTKTQFLFAIKHIVQQPESEFIEWTLTAMLEEKSIKEATFTTAPTESDYDRLGEYYFSKGIVIETSAGQFIIRNIHQNRGSKPGSDFFGYTSGWRITANLPAGLMQPFDQKKFFTAIPIYQDILQALIYEYPPKRAEIFRETYSYFIGPCPPFVDPEIIVSYIDKTLIEEAYTSVEDFYKQWDKVSFYHQNGLLLERDINIILESDYKMSALQRGMNLMRIAKASHLAKMRGFYTIEPSPYDQEKLDQKPSYLEQIGYNEADKSLEFTAYIPEDDFFSPRDLFLLMAYAENGTADGKTVATITLTFPNKAMAEKEAVILRYLDYIKIQYLANNGQWLVLD